MEQEKMNLNKEIKYLEDVLTWYDQLIFTFLVQKNRAKKDQCKFGEDENLIQVKDSKKCIENKIKYLKKKNNIFP